MKEILQHYQPKPLGQSKKYSVLIPLIKIDHEWHILYQIRSEFIPQPGEVSFPGGGVESGESFREAALRETCEELLLSPQQITILGEIDYFVHQHRTIHCFVGQLLVEDWKQIQPNPDEVARLFTIPLNELLANPPIYHPLELSISEEQDFPFERIRNGHDYPFVERDRTIPFYNLHEENIWGMTALFTHRFTEILKENGH
ncbi:NUDIX hydrolase [Streptococcus ovis]|uniref:NUDIX hydrolase n=1 Tax=Streptococcus ovis TaxID=82806 RepID=UPI000365E133|nr:CoA pyrophosphatase [Streptococcus ovis]